MKYCIVYLASPQESRLTTKQLRFDMLCKSIQNTTKVFDSIDYYIFHENLDEEHRNTLKSLHKTNTYFKKLDFVRDDLPFKKFGRPKGYMLMCRFFSGELQQFLIKEGYDSYIRFDDDSFLLEPILKKEDIEIDMAQNSYIFRSMFIDGQPKYNNGIPMQSLYDFTCDFVTKKGYSMDQLFPILLKQNFLMHNGLYSGLAPYNNFHATNLEMWKQPLIEDYIISLQKHNGCLMHFWMDANIHAMILFILCPLINEQIQVKTNFGYRHNRHFSQLGGLQIIYRNGEDFFPSN